MEPCHIKCGAHPDHVYELDDTHYFYWRIELGFPEVELFGRKFPLPFPIKFHDYEPVKSINTGGITSVLSRFHYHILTYFNKPKLVNGKPIVDFSFGSHTPIILTELTSQVHVGRDRRWEPLWDAFDINSYEVMNAIFEAILDHTLKLDESLQIDSYAIEDGDVKNDYRLKPEDIYGIVWLGKIPTREEFAEIGYDPD